MTNIRIRDIEGYEAFKAECDFFRCEEEYPGWVGEEKYGIITGLSKDELESKYPQFIAVMSPYVLLSLEFGEIRAEAKRSEHKHEMRAKRTISEFEIDEEAEAMHPELSTPDFITEMLEQEEKEKNEKERIMFCREILSHFNEEQKTRLIKYFILNKSMDEIAKEEGCSLQAVSQALMRAKNKFQKLAQKPFSFDTPLCMHYEGVSSILERIAASTESEKKNDVN